MPSQLRLATAAAEHQLGSSRSQQPASRTAFVVLQKSRRAPIEVPEAAKEGAPVA